MKQSHPWRRRRAESSRLSSLAGLESLRGPLLIVPQSDDCIAFTEGSTQWDTMQSEVEGASLPLCLHAGLDLRSHT
jgi:hypothetical protein